MGIILNNNGLNIYEINQPGSMLSDIKALSLIRNICRSYQEGVYCYEKYKVYRDNNILEYTNEFNSRLQNEKDKNEINIQSIIEQGLDVISCIQNQDINIKRNLWNSGIMPVSIKRHEKFIYVKMFIFSLDNIYKFISVLDREFPSKNIKEEKDYIDSTFPALIEIRNSIHHMEDRVRKLGKNRKKIETSGVVINCMSNDEFFTMLADGSLGTLQISSDTLYKFRAVIEKILLKFEWIGTPRTYI